MKSASERTARERIRNEMVFCIGTYIQGYIFMLYTVPQYIDIINDSYGLTRTLGVIEPCRDAHGQPEFTVGNSSVIFRIMRDGRPWLLKCYTRPKRNTRRIYGERCLHDELFIPGCGGAAGEWVDAVLMEWIEGRTLRAAVEEAVAAGDAEAFARLSRGFDRFAVRMLDEEWAHGDIKPENIIVDADGVMHAIDFDAVFLPQFAGEQSEETGTAAYQHPSRDVNLFDKTIDDYPLALISTALFALSIDPSTGRRYPADEVLLFDAREIFSCGSRALSEVLLRLRSEGMGARYRIASMLSSSSARLCGLRKMLEYALFVPDRDAAGECTPVLAECGGRWGYNVNGRMHIPPVYDSGFEFSDGRAVVRLGGTMHVIDTCGRAASSAASSVAEGEKPSKECGAERRSASTDECGADPPPQDGAANLNIRAK